MKCKGQKQFDEFNLIGYTKYPNKSYGYMQLLIIINSHRKLPRILLCFELTNNLGVSWLLFYYCIKFLDVSDLTLQPTLIAEQLKHDHIFSDF